ncbi:hypothetical protein GH714_009491 [Hevea brasiliensis]|uniref:Uncharacterized protein n=1 Tax=Hevea brasiliensis TaxID=3981 RepID=A0A6A6KI70_HEVBR|nr:hypothetical protein GH714_009491 [Hevea brasiliensis]
MEMAGCASSFRLSNALNLQNNVVLGCCNLMIRNNFRLKTFAKGAVTFHVQVRHISVQKQRLVVRNSQTPSEPQSGVGTHTVVKHEGVENVVGKDVKILENGNKLKTDVGSNGGEVEARGASLPSDILEAAKSVGVRKLLLLRYLDLQGSGGLLGFAMKSCSMLRTECWRIHLSCSKSEQRGVKTSGQFELFVADLLVGVVVNVALVGMLAPYVRIGQPSVSKGLFGRLLHAYGALPSSVFEAERPGCRFSVHQRIATYFYKGVLYGSVGFACGLIGQGIANLIMTAKRSIKKSEDDIPVPPLVKSAALWGMLYFGV